LTCIPDTGLFRYNAVSFVCDLGALVYHRALANSEPPKYAVAAEQGRLGSARPEQLPGCVPVPPI